MVCGQHLKGNIMLSNPFISTRALPEQVPPEAVFMEKKIFISIILPVYNQANTIQQCLETLVAQTYAPKEIIVVNDGSVDQTMARLMEYPKIKSIRILDIANSGRSAARNIGAQESRGSIIAFAEGDAEYDPTYLAEGLKFFTDPKIGAAYVQHQAYHRNGWIAEAVWLEREILFKGYKPFSAWFYRKDIFTALGGFDESLDCAEDQDLARRLRMVGWQIGFEPRVLWWHREPDSLAEVIRRSFWRGRHKTHFYKKYPTDVPILKLLLTILGFASLFFGLIYRPLLLTLLSCSGLLFLWKTLSISKKGWKIVEKKQYIAVIAALSIIRNIFSSLGTMLGFLESYFLEHFGGFR